MSTRTKTDIIIYVKTNLPDEILVLQEISSAVVRERNVRVLLGDIIDILHRRMGMLRGTFTLLEDWLFLYYVCGWKYERQRTCALPISRNNIRGAEILSEYDPNDPYIVWRYGTPPY